MMLTLVYWGCLCLDGVVYPSVGAFVSYGKALAGMCVTAWRFVIGYSSCPYMRMRGSDLETQSTESHPSRLF